MRRNINSWCKSCHICQQSKVTFHTKAPLAKFAQSTPFSYVHIDLVGPLPVSNSFRYLLTMIDRSTRWFEVCALIDITTTTVIETFTHCWISRYGVPEYVVTDRGAQFTSYDFKRFCVRYGISHNMTTSYHP